MEKKPTRSPGNPLPDPILVLSYDHLGVILWRTERIRKNLQDELERLEKYPGFAVGWDHEAYTYDYLAENEPELLADMRRALRRFPDRLSVGTCTYGQPLATFINEESNVRQLVMAVRTVRKRLGRDVPVYIMSEHAMHSQMPQLLVGCGFRGAVLRTHFMMYGYNPTIDEPVVWWCGLDGSRIPAVPTYRDHESLLNGAKKPPFGAVTLCNRILTDYPEKYEGDLNEFRSRFGGRIRPLVASRADDPRQREEIIAVHADDPTILWTTVERVFDQLPRPRVDFPTKPSDFGVRMPWGYCGNAKLGDMRRAETQVLAAERLSAFTRLLGGAGRTGELEHAWKNLLVGQHHDIQITNLPDDARRYLGTALVESRRIIDDCMSELAPRIGAAVGRRYVVFNPLPWERWDWIDTGDENGFAASLPGLGFKAFPGGAARPASQRAVEWEPHSGLLTTRDFAIRLAENGGFSSLLDRRSGSERLLTERPSGTLAGTIDGKACVSQASAAVRAEGERAQVIENGSIGPLPFEARWTVFADIPRIEWRCTIEFHGEQVGQPDAAEGDPWAIFDHHLKLRLRFYPAFSGAAVGVHDVPFAIAETDDELVEGNYWTALSDGERGLAFFNRGLMGSIRESDGAFSVPLAYCGPYAWDGENPVMLKGAQSYELALMPFVGPWQGADIHRRGLEYDYPALAVSVEAVRDPLGAEYAPLQVHGGEGAVLSAFFSEEDAVFARFYEHRGVEAEVGLLWNGKRVALTEVDLLGQPRAALGRALPLGPWQIRTVRLDLT